MKRMWFMVVLLLFMAVGCTATDTPQPFGFRDGMTLDEIKIIDPEAVNVNNDVYILRTAPDHHRDVDFYVVKIHKDEGLYVIKAMFNDVKCNDYGDQLKDKFAETRRGLIQQYGQPTHDFDFVRSGALWDEDRYFMRAISEEQRYLAAGWTKGDEPLIGKLVQIELTTNAFREYAQWYGFVSVAYFFEGHEQYAEEGKERPRF